MIEALRHYVNLRHTDWSEHLIHVESAMNNSTNATTGKTPTELVYGAPLRLFPSPKDIAKPEVDMPAVSDYIQRIQDNVALSISPPRSCKYSYDTKAGTLRAIAAGGVRDFTKRNILTAI